jgi:hypothetical protein
MKEFHSLAAFSEHLIKIAAVEELLVRRAVSHCAKLVEKEAKAEIGHYQHEAGPFIAWQELSENTLNGGYANGIRYPGKIELGYATDDEHNPLLRTGEMRDSIGTTISTDGMEAQIGSNSDIAVYQELGTDHIPPRSFLGGAMARKLPEIRETLGMAVYTALIGGGVHAGALLIED